MKKKLHFYYKIICVLCERLQTVFELCLRKEERGRHLIFHTIAYGKTSSNKIKAATAGELFVDQVIFAELWGSLILLLKVRKHAGQN